MKEGYFFKTRSRVPPPWPSPDNVTSVSIRSKNQQVESTLINLSLWLFIVYWN